ncbi:MAG: hypothetical protein IH846_15245 [Acidobacteria bacterium]|nr:hypothetical protein [Acidobacteriota bacterium]
MPDIIAISPADLLINPDNPRIANQNLDQREAQRALAVKGGETLDQRGGEN